MEKNETSGRKDKQGEYYFLTILAKFITNQRWKKKKWTKEEEKKENNKLMKNKKIMKE